METHNINILPYSNNAYVYWFAIFILYTVYLGIEEHGEDS
jgi:hypothetical protein